MEESSVLTSRDGKGICTVTLNRPEVHNAFDEGLIASLTEIFGGLEKDSSVRVVVLSAKGKSFSAGGDLNWMRRVAGYSYEENLKDSLVLAELLRMINELPKPVVCRVQGAAFGGGVGLASCCDIVVAGRRASFALSEVKLGLIPAVISPYVVEAIGSRAARRYFLTGERFGAEEAKILGLVHEITEDDKLDEKVDEICGALLGNGPAAIGEAKDLVTLVSRGEIDSRMIQETGVRISRVRASDEGKEGVNAFLEKRPPRWVEGKI